jgi:hypothetical protein
MKRLIEEAKELVKETIWTWFADEPMQVAHVKITFIIMVIGLLIVGGFMELVK